MTTISLRQRAGIALAGAIAATAASIVGAPDADARLYYGAIAYAPNGAWGSSWNYPTRGDAEQTALNYCGYGSCKVLSTFTGCGAVAYDGSYYHGGTGPTLAAAQNDAIANLGGGYIDSWACN